MDRDLNDIRYQILQALDDRCKWDSIQGLVNPLQGLKTKENGEVMTEIVKKIVKKMVETGYVGDNPGYLNVYMDVVEFH